jgi:hypothetical protein
VLNILLGPPRRNPTPGEGSVSQQPCTFKVSHLKRNIIGPDRPIMQASNSCHLWLEKEANDGEGESDTIGEVHAAPRLARVDRRLTG